MASGRLSKRKAYGQGLFGEGEVGNRVHELVDNLRVLEVELVDVVRRLQDLSNEQADLEQSGYMPRHGMWLQREEKRTGSASFSRLGAEERSLPSSTIEVATSAPA